MKEGGEPKTKRITLRKHLFEDFFRELFGTTGIELVGCAHFSSGSLTNELTLNCNFSTEDEAKIRNILKKHFPDYQIFIQDSEALKAKIKEYDEKLPQLPEGQEKNLMKTRREEAQCKVEELEKHERTFKHKPPGSPS